MPSLRGGRFYCRGSNGRTVRSGAAVGGRRMNTATTIKVHVVVAALTAAAEKND